MGEAYSWESRERAEELYCVDELTFDQVAEQTGIAASTLKRWSADYGWQDKRQEIAKARCSIRANTILARAAMLEKLVNQKDAMDGFAVAKLEELALKQAQAQRAGDILQQEADLPRREIRTAEDAAAALREAVELKLARMLADPAQVDFRALTDVRKALDLIGEMEPQAAKKATRGLSPEAVRQIEDLLGYQR